ncbi:AAA family ATPase [Pedobacter sp.]|nr:AAA family ATPase [Candidatus Saccharibacteria bacterium]
MDQTLALEIMHSGESVLLTGPAGSGKTYVLNEFIRRARAEGKHVSVTATTGLAATHLSGNTIHAWSGIGVNDELPADFEDYLLKSRRDIIETTDVLIIDEISMLHDYRLDMVDTVARIVRDDERPFGGIQVILCGDFFQLPPVNRSDSRQGSFVVNSKVWKELDPVICYLAEQHRQDDEKFLDILNALRAGDIRRNHAETLMEKIGAPLDHEEAVTELHTVNVDVDRINAAKLKAVEGEEHFYTTHTTGAANYVATLKRSCLALETLTLKTGALVMCIKNSPERKYVNGSLGIVTGYEAMTEYPIVELRNGKTVTMKPETWELRDGDKKRASLSQIPLRLAWAITVHKSQGMTLDAARIDLRRAFVEGMGYVALSRVRRLDSLSLLGLNRIALRISDEALQMDESLRKKACDDHARFEHLRANAKKRATKAEVEKKKMPSTWSERLEKMRLTHPNAYKPWTKQDDALLTEKFQLGMDIKKLSKLLGRNDKSIILRIQKHFGEDAAQL